MSGYLRIVLKASVFNLGILLFALSLGMGVSIGKPGGKGHSAHASGPGCPADTVEKNGICELEEPLILESGETLDCKGRTLQPSKFGEINGARSVPEVAIIIHQKSGVTVKNCILDRFDTGIFAVDNKASVGNGGHKVLDNVIKARHFDVVLASTDNTVVRDNELSVTATGSTPVQVQHNSDLNRVVDNQMIGDYSAARDLGPDWPGQTEPLTFEFGIGVFTARFMGNVDTNLLNSVIDGKLYQILADPFDETEDNVFEGNTFTTNGLGDVGGAFEASATTRTTFRGNVFQGAADFGIVTNTRGRSVNVRTLGTCQKEPSRFCLENDHCNIPGFDSSSKGGCSGSNSVFVDERDIGSVIENNVLSGPFTFSGILLARSLDTRVTGNTVEGPSGRAGIIFQGQSLETSTITRNIVSGHDTALVLVNQQFADQLPADFFGAKVSLNDFTGYTRAIFASHSDQDSFNVAHELGAGNYNLPSELSVDENGEVCTPTSVGCRGNYWELDNCAEGGFDPDKVLGPNDGLLETDVTDSHPYGQPVAGLSDGELRKVETCPEQGF